MTIVDATKPASFRVISFTRWPNSCALFFLLVTAAVPANAASFADAIITLISKLFYSFGVEGGSNDIAGYFYILVFLVFAGYSVFRMGEIVWQYAMRVKTGDPSLGASEYLVLLVLGSIAGFSWLMASR